MKTNNIDKINSYFAKFIFVTLILSVIVIVYVCCSVNKLKQKRLLDIARTAESAYFSDILPKLDFAPSDIDKPEYYYLKSSLIKIRNINNDARFVYIYGYKDGKVLMVADSEALTSADYSPPGEELTNPNQDILKKLMDGKSIITKPTPDKFGVWISVLVPIKKADSNEVVATFGMDYPASHWYFEVIKNLTKILFFLAVIYSLVFYLKNKIIQLVAKTK